MTGLSCRLRSDQLRSFRLTRSKNTYTLCACIVRAGSQPAPVSTRNLTVQYPFTRSPMLEVKNLEVVYNDVIQVLKGVSLDLSLIHISEPTRRTPISYAVFCLKKK